MIDGYAGSRAGWRWRVGINREGTPIYEPAPPEEPEEIRARVEYGRRLVRDADGEETLSETVCLTSAPVEPGDLIIYGGREWPVLAVQMVFGLGGGELHRECRLYWQRSASAKGTTR